MARQRTKPSVAEAAALAVLLRKSDLGNALRTLYTHFYGARRRGEITSMQINGVDGYFVPEVVMESVRRALWKSQQHQYADRVGVGSRAFGATREI